MFRIQCRFLIVLCLSVGLLHPLEAHGENSLELIENAYLAGRIDTGERLIYRLMTVRDQVNLPVEFRSDAKLLGKDATEIFLEATYYIDSLPANRRAALEKYLARPSQSYSFDSPDGHYKIHYDKSGSNAVPLTDGNGNGVPDYVEWLANYADSAWRCTHTHLGYDVPPVDNGAGGDNRYDIYTEEMPYYGYTQPEGSGTSRYSYASVHRNFYGFPANDDPEGDQKGAMKVTTAHEYFHAVQLGIYAYADLWYMEVSSTWMEEICYPAVNDNCNYFGDFFNYPHYSLNSTSGLHLYGAFVWNRFIDQYFDTLTVRQVWERMRSTMNGNAYTSLNSIFVSHGSSLNDAFVDFTEWNYICSGRDDGNHYEDGFDYPYIKIMRTHSASSYPLSTQSPITSQRPSQMSCNYVLLYAPSDPGDFVVQFDGQNGYNWVVQLIKKEKGVNVFDVIPMELNVAKAGSTVVYGTDDYDYFVLVPSVAQTSGSSLSYTYSAYVFDSSIGVDVIAGGPGQVYSNTEREVQFVVENTGQITDDFLIDVTDDLGWALAASQSVVYLTPGEIDTVIVTATCPAGCAGGLTNTITLTATSYTQPQSFDRDTLSLETLIMFGDANNSGEIDIDDVVYLIAYIFSGGPPPIPDDSAGDANCVDCDGPYAVDIDDAVFLIAYIFSGGPAPPCNPF